MSAIESVLVENRVFPPPEPPSAAPASPAWPPTRRCARRPSATSRASGPGWRARTCSWTKPFTRTLDESNAPFYKWFDDGELNASANCLDKHIGTPVENKTAIIFEADDGTVTTRHLQGTAGARLPVRQRAQGAGHPQGRPRHHLHADDASRAWSPCRPARASAPPTAWCSAASRPRRCRSASSTPARWRSSPPTTRCAAARSCRSRPSSTRASRMGGCDTLEDGAGLQAHADAPATWWRAATRPSTRCWQGQPTECAPEPVGAEHPLFILYTSGSTGKPKGVQHSTGGYLLWAKLTMDWTFDIRPDDVFWCTADIGWITGHTYVAYGPLAAGAHAGDLRGHPDLSRTPGRFWQMIEKHKVTIFYTAPTAIRSLIKAAETDEKVHPKNWDLSSACASWARSASRSTPKPGCGTTGTSAASAARSSTPSGRPRPAAT